MDDIETFNSMLCNEDTTFHYTKSSIALEHILSSKKFRFPSLNNTNNPHKYKFWYYESHGWGDYLKDRFREKFDRVHMRFIPH